MIVALRAARCISGTLQRQHQGPFEFWHVPLYPDYDQTHESLAGHLKATLEGYGAEVTIVDSRGVEPAPLPELAERVASQEVEEEASANPYGMLPPVPVLQ